MKRLTFVFSLIVVIISPAFGQLALELTPELQAEIDLIPELILTPASENTTLPESVDNAGKIWMRDIFDQEGNSCAQAAAVGIRSPMKLIGFATYNPAVTRIYTRLILPTIFLMRVIMRVAGIRMDT